MELDAVDGLVTLGLVSLDQATAAARIPDVSLGRFGRLALVGVDVAALLPALAAFSGMKVAPPELLSTPSSAGLAPEVQARLRALPACPVRRSEGGALDVVIADPACRARVVELLGPGARPWLALEHTVRTLAAQCLVDGPAPAPAGSAPAPAASAAPAVAPRAAVMSGEIAAFVEGARAAHGALSPAAFSAAMAEQVDLSDDDKRRVLELDAKIDRASPAALLGVDAEATDDEIKERYYELSRAVHPDTHFRRRLGTFKPRAIRVFRALKKACDTLVAEAERRDHLDLGGGGSAANRPAAPTPAPAPALTASSSQRLRGLISLDNASARERTAPNTPALPTPMPSAQPRPRQHRPMGEIELELPSDGATPDLAKVVRRADATAATAPLEIDPSVVAPRPRPTTAVRAPEGKVPVPSRTRRVAVAAAAVVATLVVVALAVALSGGGATRAPTQAPADQQAALLDQARAAAVRGDHAEAVAYASDALRISEVGDAAAHAHAIRGCSLVKNGDRAEGLVELGVALERLPPGDPLRGEVEAAMRQAKP